MTQGAQEGKSSNYPTEGILIRELGGVVKVCKRCKRQKVIGMYTCCKH